MSNKIWKQPPIVSMKLVQKKIVIAQYLFYLPAIYR